MSDDFAPTDRTTIGRAAHRGSRSRAEADAILDEGLLCHLGVVPPGDATGGAPVVIPTTHARRGRDLLLHGSPAATWLRSTGKGTPVCVTVTHLDALVVARSAFHHSMNYRSVVIFGTAVRVDDPDEKLAALDALVEHILPGRVAEVRPNRDDELAQTLVLRLPLDEASVKVRAGGPIDDEADLDSDVWAGLIPIATAFGAPVADDALDPSVPVPPSVVGYQRPSR